MKYLIPIILTIFASFFNIYVVVFNLNLFTLKLDVLFWIFAVWGFLIEINIRVYKEND